MLPRTIELYPINNFYGGLNLADSPNSLAPNQCLKLQNFSFGDGNMLEVRNGVTHTNSITLGTAPIYGIWRYGDNSGNYYKLAVSNGYMVGWPSYNAPLQTFYSLTATATATGDAVQMLTDGYKSDWQPHIDNVYHSNGADNQIVYNHTPWRNGTYWRRTGCPTPTATTAGATATTGTGTAGGDLPAGTYKFLWTLELADGDIICEGNPNTVNAAAHLASAGKINISITAPDSEGIRQTCNLYATDADQDVYYFLTAMSITADGPYAYEWNDYTVLDTGDTLEYDNYRPPIGSVNRLFQNHMFITGVNAHPNYIYISKFGRPEQFPGNVAGGDPVASSYIIDCEDKVLALEIASNGGLCVICENSVQLITGYSSDTFARTYISRSTTCVGQHAVALGNEGKIYWVGRDNVYATNGNEVIKIGRMIWSELKGINTNGFTLLNAFFHNNRFYISYPSSSSATYADRLLEFDTRFGDSSFGDDEIGTIGAWLGPHIGPTISCFCKTLKEDETEAYFGSGSAAALYQFDEGNDDAGTTIDAELNTGIIYVGAPLLTKRFLAIGCEVKDCASINTLSLEIDNGATSIPSIPISTTVGSSVWLGDDSTEDHPLWSGDEQTGSYDASWYINWGGDSWGYFKYGLPQEATGDCIQIKLYVKADNGATPAVADRYFALRNLGLMYSTMRRFWR